MDHVLQVEYSNLHSIYAYSKCSHVVKMFNLDNQDLQNRHQNASFQRMRESSDLLHSCLFDYFE